MSAFLRRHCGTMLLVACLVAFALFQNALAVIDLDLFHEMALAREALELGTVPWKDSFAYTPTVDMVVHHEWGLGLIAVLLAKTAGGSGIILIKFVLIYGLGIIVWKVARARGAGPFITSLFIALGLIISDSGITTVRANMFSYMFVALLLAGFDRDRSGDRKWLIGVAVLFPVWANIHGGCLVGAALFAMHWLEQLIRRQPHWHLFWMGLALVPLAAINPWGFHFHHYLVHAMLLPRPAIIEWSPLWSPDVQVQSIHFCVSLPFLFLTLKQAGVRRVPGILVVFATALASIKSARFLPFYGIAFACYLPATFSQIGLGRHLRRWWLIYRAAICGVLGLTTVVLVAVAITSKPWLLLVPSHQTDDRRRDIIYPVGAVNYLAENRFTGNVMVPFSCGSYVMWKLGPAVKVSFDSRYEVAYPPTRYNENEQFYDATEGWEKELDQYPTDVVLAAVNRNIVRLMEQRAGWKQVYRDPQFVLFARQSVDLSPVETNVPAPDGQFP